MPRVIALLRAINVGGRVVKMDRLRTIFESMGFTQVETFIASGNVIFEHRARNLPALGAKIEKMLERELGYPVVTFLRTAEELAACAAHEAGKNVAQGDAFYVGFLQEPPSTTARNAVESLSTPTDQFTVDD